MMSSIPEGSSNQFVLVASHFDVNNRSVSSGGLLSERPCCKTESRNAMAPSSWPLCIVEARSAANCLKAAEKIPWVASSKQTQENTSSDPVHFPLLNTLNPAMAIGRKYSTNCEAVCFLSAQHPCRKQKICPFRFRVTPLNHEIS
jgi:hypothetical protein